MLGTPEPPWAAKVGVESSGHQSDGKADGNSFARFFFYK